jgi:hypothetical protein
MSFSSSFVEGGTAVPSPRSCSAVRRPIIPVYFLLPLASLCCYSQQSVARAGGRACGPPRPDRCRLACSPFQHRGCTPNWVFLQTRVPCRANPVPQLTLSAVEPEPLRDRAGGPNRRRRPCLCASMSWCVVKRVARSNVATALLRRATRSSSYPPLLHDLSHNTSADRPSTLADREP